MMDPSKQENCPDDQINTKIMSTKENDTDIIEKHHFQLLTMESMNNIGSISNRSFIPNCRSSSCRVSNIESIEERPILQSSNINLNHDNDDANQKRKVYLPSIHSHVLRSTNLSEHAAITFSSSEKSFRASFRDSKRFLSSSSCKARMNSTPITTHQKREDVSIIIDMAPSPISGLCDQLPFQSSNVIIPSNHTCTELNTHETQLQTALETPTTRIVLDAQIQEQSLRDKEDAALARLQKLDRENQQKLRCEKEKIVLLGMSERKELQRQFLQQRQAIESYVQAKGAIIREKYGQIRKGVQQTPFKSLEVVITSAPVLVEVCVW